MTNFEIRIPACDRPDLLRRALQSLQAQTYPHWKAIVYDDSSSSDVKNVVKCTEDQRISYCRNFIRLGAAKNIDQCFKPVPLVGGEYGCLLEDDNFWLPGLLSLVADKVSQKKWSVVLCNQRVNEQGVGLCPPSKTTRGDWFSGGGVEPLTLRATLLFMEGLSNGGLIWALNGETNLQVGPAIRETGLQEACRSLLMETPFLFLEEPLAVWTSMPRRETARAGERNRLISRGMQSVRDFILDTHGAALIGIARAMASRLGLSARLAETIAYSGHPMLLGNIGKGSALSILRAFLKGLAIRLVESDPCAAFFHQGRPANLLGVGIKLDHDH